MKRIWITLLIVTTQVSFSCTTAYSYYFSGRPNCPWAKPGNTWVKYLSGEYGDKEPLFSVQFTRTFGDMYQKKCFTMNYMGDQKWAAAGQVGNKSEAAIHVTRGGDPKEMKMNIWNKMFTFNEAGELYLVEDGQLAGYMYCHFGDECWK